MKKPKIKPQVFYMTYHDECGAIPEHTRKSPREARMSFEKFWNEKWRSMERQGWRIVKVRISEVK
jgi:saccharopine dehydrogenase-like NADP-dependent oxidoreductase